MEPTVTLQPNQPIQQPASIQPPLTPQKQNHSGLLIFIILILMGVASYFGYQNWQMKQQTSQVQPTPTPIITPVTTVDPKVNWKIYTNKAFNFSFKYPPELTYIYDQTDQYVENGVSNAMILIQNFDGSRPRTETDSDFQIVIYIANKSGNFNLENPQGEQTKSTINGIDVIKSFTTQKWVLVPTVFFQSFPNKVAVQLSNPKSSNAVWFDQILSTFKFTNQISEIPNNINAVFTAINRSFGSNIVPTKESQFYSLRGFVNQVSWKLDVSSLLTDKSQFTILFNTLEKNLKQDINSAADGVGQSVQGYENDQIYCFLLRGFNASDYISCVEK